MNKLLDFYCRMLYFCKGRPTTLSQLSNWELNGILLHINKYPQGLLNGYDKSVYILAVNYILKERLHCKDYKRNITETRLANKALETSNELSNLILKCMINTEQRYKRKLVRKNYLDKLNNMKIVTKVKGVDDFGKEKMSGNVFKYSHHYPRINEGDFLIYFYPKDNAIGIYQAKEELEYYYKDGFQYCSGKMCRYEKSALDFIEWIKSKDIELAGTFEKTMNDLIEKYSCALAGN